jgi:hypothetical protein
MEKIEIENTRKNSHESLEHYTLTTPPGDFGSGPSPDLSLYPLLQALCEYKTLYQTECRDPWGIRTSINTCLSSATVWIRRTNVLKFTCRHGGHT